MVHPSLKNMLMLPCGTPGCGGQQVFTFKIPQAIHWRCSVCNKLQSTSKMEVASALKAKQVKTPNVIN